MKKQKTRNKSLCTDVGYRVVAYQVALSFFSKAVHFASFSSEPPQTNNRRATPAVHEKKNKKQYMHTSKVPDKLRPADAIQAVCVFRHIGRIFPPVYIPHNLCPCRCLLLVERRGVLLLWLQSFETNVRIAKTAR